jgi:HK97 family phage prohead protease
VGGVIRLEGLAAVYGRVDRAGDVIRAGAFGAAGAVPLLLQHRGKPVGEILALREEAGGLRVEARVDEAEAARLVACGALPGLSVGYRPRIVRQGARREIVRAELVEVSLVAVPMQPAARVETVERI